MTLPWYWYRLTGPLYRLHRRWRDARIRKDGWRPTDCPWCGIHNEGVYLTKPYNVPIDWREGWQRCWRCCARWWAKETE